MAKIKPKEWARKSAEARARLEAEADAPKAAPAKKGEIDDARLMEIRADAWRASNWASVVNYGPACSCGLRRSGGTCARHGDYRAPSTARTPENGAS